MDIVATAGLLLIQKHPQNQIVNDTQKAMFECFVNGSNSSVTVIWEKDQKKYETGNSENVMHSNGVTSTLTINEATMKDSGKFRCNATNADGKSVTSQEAELISKLTI